MAVGRQSPDLPLSVPMGRWVSVMLRPLVRLAEECHSRLLAGSPLDLRSCWACVELLGLGDGAGSRCGAVTRAMARLSTKSPVQPAPGGLVQLTYSREVHVFDDGCF